MAQPLEPNTIQSIKPFTPSALKELEFWLEPWFKGLTQRGGAGDGGLLYNAGTYGPLNLGDWLDVEVNGNNTDTGHAMLLHSDNGGDIEIVTGGGAGNIALVNDGSGLAVLQSNSGIARVQSGLSGVQIIGGTTVGILANSGTFIAEASVGTTEALIQFRTSTGNYVSILNGIGPVEQFRLTIGSTGTNEVMGVKDATGASIFSVRANGDIHLKAGATITYDL